MRIKAMITDRNIATTMTIKMATITITIPILTRTTPWARVVC